MKRFYRKERPVRRLALLLVVCFLATAVPALSYTAAAGETVLPGETSEAEHTEEAAAATAEPETEQPQPETGPQQETGAPLLLAPNWGRLPRAGHAAEGYVFYHSKETPYYRLSPHRASSRGEDGKTDTQVTSGLFTLVDLRAYGGKNFHPAPMSDWSLQNAGNYLTAYCCDLLTADVPGTVYRRINLEDAGYYGDENAAKIRAVVEHSYPFETKETMIQALLTAGALEERDGVVSSQKNFADGQTPAATLGESELLSAVQLAVWKYANAEQSSASIQSLYTKTLGHPAKGVLYPDPTPVVESNSERIRNNIESVYIYLTGLPAAAPKPRDGVVVSEIFYAAERIEAEDGGVAVQLRFRLNGSIGADDAVTLSAGGEEYALENAVGSLPVLSADSEGAYLLTLTGLGEQDTVEIAVRGVQKLARGVYFYEPYGGSGKAQCFVGAAQGETVVCAQSSFCVASLCEKTRIKKIALVTGRDMELPLPGAQLRLVLRRAGYADLVIRDGLVTDAEGEAAVRRLSPPRKGETYVFIETRAPEGYRLPAEPEIAAELSGTVRLVNTAETVGSVTLEKRDGSAPDMKLSDAVFALYRITGPATALRLGEFVTDGEGRIAVSNLPAGQYRFEEITPPEGYRLNETTSYSFAVTKEMPHPQLVVENFAFLTVAGEKRWEDGEDRHGLRPERVTVYLCCGGAAIGRQEVSAQTEWKYAFADLPIYDEDGRLNIYSVVETPIPGYQADYEETGIRNTLRTAELRLAKRSRGGDALQGASFMLKNASGTVQSNTASGAQGEIVFSNLPVGEYQLTETRAPKGYRLAAAPWRVIVSDPNTAADGALPLVVTVEDSKGRTIEDGELLNDPKLMLPRTGGTGAIPFLAAGGALLLAAGCGIYKIKRIRRES